MKPKASTAGIAMWLAGAVAAFLLMGLAVPAAAAGAAASFLSIDPSASTAVLGDNALTEGTAAAFRNPAGLCASEHAQIFTSHADLFLGSSFNSVAYLQPLGGASKASTRTGEPASSSAGTEKASGFWNGADSVEFRAPRGAESLEAPSAGPARRTVVGVSALYLDRGSIAGVSDDGTAASSFGAGDTAFGLSIAHRFSALSAGFAVKSLEERIGPYSARSVAVDAGLQAPMPIRRLSAGVALLNAGSGMKFVSERERLPTTLAFGLGYTRGLLSLTGNASVLLADGRTKVGLGTEFHPYSGVVLRAGYVGAPWSTTAGSGGGLSALAGLGAGLGLHVGRYQLDYAVVPHPELGQAQFISLSANFN